MSEIRCKRCNRILKNKLSIEHGYGDKCYRIIQLNKKEPNESIIDELLNRVRKLELDNSFMKHQLKHKTIVNSNVESIERIKLDEQRPERNEFKIQFNVVVKELKIVFNKDNFDYHDILEPINVREIIEKPPMIEVSV